jgi:hypothetical protein
MSQRLSTKWLATIGVVGLVGVGTTVGLVNSVGATPGKSSSVSPAAASPVTTASFTFSVSVSGLTPTTVTVTGSGQADFQNDAASVMVNVPAGVAKLIPGGSGSPQTINATFSGDTVYLQVPGLASKIGAPWISVALPTKATSAIPGGFTKVASALGNVNSIVEFAKAHHATVTPLPSATVNNTPATGDKIVVTRTHAGKTHTITTSVWADSSDRLVEATVASSGATKFGSLGVTATVDFTNYGSPVTITVPAPSQVKAIPLSMVKMFTGMADHRAAGIRRFHSPTSLG